MIEDFVAPDPNRELLVTDDAQRDSGYSRTKKSRYNPVDDLRRTDTIKFWGNGYRNAANAH